VLTLPFLSGDRLSPALQRWHNHCCHPILWSRPVPKSLCSIVVYETLALGGAIDALYRKVYQKMYARLQPLNLDLQKITGYPRLY